MNPIEAAQRDARACEDAGDIPGAEQVWQRFADGDYEPAGDGDEVTVERGMLLLVKNEPREGMELPVRYELWTVTSVRGASVKLLALSGGTRMEATATFPGGVVADPWRVFGPSQNDLALVWSRAANSQERP